MEDVASFRARARHWVSGNLPAQHGDPEELPMEQAKALQAAIFDAGFAGIAVPVEYGGAGLTLEHQQAWAEEVAGFQVPAKLYPSIAILGMTLLDHGCEAAKARHLPRILRGDEVWIQLLSEPSGGSDLAGVLTRATRDGESWLITGAKTWSSLADAADYGLCLARSDWDVPKHRGLSMFALPLGAPGVTIEPIVSSRGGPAHFFQEYFDEVRLPAEYLLGDENEGWSVAHTLLVHERNAIAGIGHGLGLGGGGEGGSETRSGVGDLLSVARSSGAIADPESQRLIASAYVDETVRSQLGERVATGLRTGALRGNWGSLVKLGLGVDTLRRAEIAVALARADGVVWPASDSAEPGAGLSDVGLSWLTARGISIGGGTNEIQRNTISERLLGMPREPAPDRDVPFGEMMRGRAPRRAPTDEREE